MRRRIIPALTLTLALAVASAAVLPVAPAVAESRSGSDIVQTLVQRSGGGAPRLEPPRLRHPRPGGARRRPRRDPVGPVHPVHGVRAERRGVHGHRARADRFTTGQRAGGVRCRRLLGIPTVTQVLLYHVVAGRRLGPLQVLLSRQLTMANGGKVGVRFIRLVDADPDARDPLLNVFRLDIAASNGVIHTIDRVLRPADL